MNVFISHSHRDKEIVRKIADRLRKEGVNPWLDEEVIRPGQSWPEVIHRAIAESDAFIVVISRATTASKWQTTEIARSVAEQQSAPQKRVIPVVIEKGAELPFFLRDRVYCDLSDDKRFEENFPRILQTLKAPQDVQAEPSEVAKARARDIKIQQDMLRSEAKELERWRVARTNTILGALASVIVASAVILTLFTPNTKLDIGLLRAAGPFAAGVIFGILSTVLAKLVYNSLQRRSTRKEVDHE